jgi:hypothetical protein
MPNQREREFRGVSEELEDLRETLDEWLGRLAPKAPGQTAAEQPSRRAPDTADPS